jgi:tripartite-type tricarboxylate transporter receptor subunit TctC
MKLNCGLGRLFGFAAFIACLCMQPGAGALAQTYPSRPIKIFVPFPPGNSADAAARTLADELVRRLGQPVVVENRPGATGSIGALAVAKSPADGYALLLASTAFTISTALGAPYDVAKDFQPVALVGVVGPMILIAAPSFPASTLLQTVELLKSNPRKYSYAHLGPGTISHLTMENFLSLIGAEAVGVQYRGSVQAITDIIGSQIPLMFDSPSSAVSFIESGKIKALAVASDIRSNRLPNVPAVTESGIAAVKNFHSSGWVGLLAPANTPRDIVLRLNAELTAIAQLPAVKQRLYLQGIDTVPQQSPEKFGEFLKGDMERWQAAATAAKVVKQ